MIALLALTALQVESKSSRREKPTCSESEKWAPIDPLDQIEKGPSSPCEKPPKGCIPFDADLFRRCTEVFAINGDFLYWQVLTGNIDYALKMKEPTWGPSDSYAQGDFESGSYSLDPGFRLGLLYFRALHDWEAKIEYTRMTGRGKNTSTNPDSDVIHLTPTWPVQPSNIALEMATSDIDFNYNVFDLLIDRHFTPNWHLRLRYGGGFTVAWMDQEWKIRYIDRVNNETNVRNEWGYTGAGLKLFSMVDWFWGYDLYMTGKFAFATLIGRYTNESWQKQTFAPTINDNPDIPVRNTHFSDTRPAFTTQFLFGPSWQRKFDSTRIEAFAGYEMNFWFNLQNVYHSTSGSPTAAKETWINNSLLGLHGLSTRLTVDF
jgi:hypothetical protein